MKPIGLIFSAIVLSLAALFLLFMAALTAIAGILAGHQPQLPVTPHFFVLAVSAFDAVLAVWAILTIIGILRLRSRGRYSILIVAGGLAVIGVVAAPFSTLFSHSMLPASQIQQPAVDEA